MKDEVLRVLFEAILVKWVFFLADVIIWQTPPPPMSSNVIIS